MGSAIRNWGPTRDVFIAIDERDPSADTNDLVFKWFTCDNAACSTATFHSPGIFVGSSLSWQNALHPALAIRSLGGSPPNIRLKILRREKIDTDCDNNGSTSNTIDQKAIDLNGYDWETANGLVGDHPVENNWTGLCYDTGFSEAKFLGSTAWACYTYGVDPIGGSDDNLACNNDSTSTVYSWANHLDLTTSGSNDEDHPSFDLYGSGYDLAVAGHYRVSGNDQVRVHFPDATAPPSEPIVSYTGSSGDADHPDILAANGQLHMVWQDGTGIRYASCDHSSTQPCTTKSSSTDWTDDANVETIASATTYPSAKFSQLAIDGDNQFVVFQYDSGTTDVRTRVMVASRCEGGSWTVEQVRTPSNSAYDQTVVFGSPALVLNQQDNVAHLLLIEADEYGDAFDFSLTGTSTLYWYRKGYTTCP